ncbi:MAG: hypothetical protein ACI9J3_000362 [Parvicellaceae bacterium]|jgi:hypothetical protein
MVIPFHLLPNFDQFIVGCSLSFPSVGSTKGLVDESIVSSSRPEVHCYYQNKLHVAQFPFADSSCDPILDNIENVMLVFKVYPNPSDRLFQIEYSSGLKIDRYRYSG